MPCPNGVYVNPDLFGRGFLCDVGYKIVLITRIII